MKIKRFVRTFTSNEDAELFNSLLQTKCSDIEQLIQQEVAKFVRTLPNKEIHLQGDVTQVRGFEINKRS